jgi:hypothetical protein
MIVCPTSNLGVEFIDQFGGRPGPCGFDDFSDAIQECFNILLGGLGEQFPMDHAGIEGELGRYLGAHTRGVRGD